MLLCRVYVVSGGMVSWQLACSCTQTTHGWDECAAVHCLVSISCAHMVASVHSHIPASAHSATDSVCVWCCVLSACRLRPHSMLCSLRSTTTSPSRPVAAGAPPDGVGQDRYAATLAPRTQPLLLCPHICFTVTSCCPAIAVNMQPYAPLTSGTCICTHSYRT